jgi:hypothetical protein
MSLRQQAKILGVFHSLLSKCLNGKRTWNPNLKERYDRLVTTLPNNGDKSIKNESLVRVGNTCLLGVKDGNGGAEEARTPDPLLAKQVLSQLSYSPL